MTQARENERLRSIPSGEQIGGPVKMSKQRPAGMSDRLSAVRL
jgi:hypothetical protein